MVTNKCTTELQSLNNYTNNTDIPEAHARTKIHNDNKVAIQWADSVTSKSIKHLYLIENIVCECHQSKDVNLEHIPGIINPRDIFTNNMKDNTNFINIIDSMMDDGLTPRLSEVWSQRYLTYHLH